MKHSVLTTKLLEKKGWKPVNNSRYQFPVKNPAYELNIFGNSIKITSTSNQTRFDGYCKSEKDFDTIFNLIKKGE